MTTLAVNSPLTTLLNTLPQRGRVEWIGIRPSRTAPMQSLNSVAVGIGQGLIGDRFSGKAQSKRQVTLIQYEHLASIAGFLHKPHIQAFELRRNLVISGINLLALKGKYFQLGNTLLEYTGLCHPCSKMEQRLGPGGYNALRGHGGITARVHQEGTIKLYDCVSVASPLT